MTRRTTAPIIAPTAGLALALIQLGCGVAGLGEVRAVALPAPTVRVAVGARHDVLVAACQDEVSIGRLLTPVAITALFVGLGRLDVAFHLPGALVAAAVPQCEPVGLAVDAAAIDGPWRLEETDNPAAFTAVAEAAGPGYFEAAVRVDGERHTVSTAFEAAPIDRIDLSVQCLEPQPSPDPIRVPAGGAVGFGERWFGAELRLTGYGLEPLDIEGEAVTVERSVFDTRLRIEAPGRVTIRSRFDPALAVRIDAFGPADVSALRLIPPEDPLFVDGVLRLGTEVEIAGGRPCVRGDRPQVVVETPEVCLLDGVEPQVEAEGRSVEVRGVSPGTCRVAVRMPETAIVERFEAPVFESMRTVARFSGADRLLALWARGPGDVFAVGYDSDISGRTDGLLLHADADGRVTTIEARRRGTLRAVHGAGEAVVAVGDRPFLLEGDALVPFDDPLFDDGPALHSVWVWGPDDIAVGGDGGFVAHYDGRGWSTIDVGHDQRITALFGDVDGSLVIAGWGPPTRWRGGVVSPIPTPDGGAGGSKVRRIGDELWFMARSGGPFSIQQGVPLLIPVAADPRSLADIVPIDGGYIVQHRGVHRVGGRLAEADDWLRLWSTHDGVARASTSATALDVVDGRVYALDGQRLLTVPTR